MHSLIYVSTDALEAQHIIEPTINTEYTNLDEIVGSRYNFHNIEFSIVPYIEKKVGFPAMSSIELPKNATKRECDTIMQLLVKHGLFVGYNRDGHMHVYMPLETKVNTKILQIMLYQAPQETERQFFKYFNS